MAIHEKIAANPKEQNLEIFNFDLLNSLKNRRDILIERYPLAHRGGNYDFFKIKSSEIKRGDDVILIRATIHGEEIAGAFSMVRHLNEVIDYAHKRGIKLIVYPLGNPSGFAKGTSFNVDGDPGEDGISNNDFLRYELPDGQLIKEIKGGKVFKRWHWSSDPRLGIRLAEETKLMHQLLRQDPLAQVVACLDLHQDYLSKGGEIAAYMYAYDDLALYKPIIASVAEIVPIWRNRDVSAGYEDGVMSNENGLIERFDGSLPDLLRRLGSRHNLTPETTGATPLKLAIEVNRRVVLGTIDLVHAGY